MAELRRRKPDDEKNADESFEKSLENPLTDDDTQQNKQVSGLTTADSSDHVSKPIF